MSEQSRHSVSVTGIVCREDARVLAIQRHDDNRWVPPGGILELHETPTAGVGREVLEETGLNVQVERLTGVYKNMIRGVVTLAFRCHVIGGHQEQTTNEAKRIRWLTIEEAKRDMPEARAIRVVDAATASGASLPVRAHDGTRLL